MSILEELNGILPDGAEVTPEDTWEMLRRRITILNERAWEGRNRWPDVEHWLANFDGRSGIDVDTERLHALFLLSQFLYVGSIETRVLLQSVFRDLFMAPLIQEVRASLGGTRDAALIVPAVELALQRTRFLGVGNPSESGVHLLYYFRQENGLSKAQFMDATAMFARSYLPDGTTVPTLGNPDIDRYVFIDDVCGSARTAISYSKNALANLLELKPDAKLYYLAMFALQDGLDRVRTESVFGERCAAVFELDETYRCLSPTSRYLHAAPPHINGDQLRMMVRTYGALLWPKHPCGFNDAQLLLGFHHNTPDNTLPVIWREDGAGVSWFPAFRRYAKL
ncbi:MAG: hypothetical protein J0I47_02110 [Sphingomonas sp.]|uniref:phosphoribosyltransferase-like protein n=1 Tax=Sphingomonas sp. TaxID=28214 RepID=UPI001AC4FC42|nr:hypothetical protein [Sphingomonas sp.]MBN8807023.1 hypothetical protein [Sphingomonas sp.]